MFDYSGESFRNQLYDQYKANRDEPPPELRPQFQLVREAARAFGLPVIDVEGFEADDLIAAYAKLGKAAGEPVDDRLLRQGPDAAGRRRGRACGTR